MNKLGKINLGSRNKTSQGARVWSVCVIEIGDMGGCMVRDEAQESIGNK